MYRGTDKYCNATTHKTCKKCRFYEPTTQTVFTTAAEEVNAAVEAYEEIVTYLEESQEIYEELREEYKKAMKAMLPLQSIDVVPAQIWIDSINTYE